MRGTTAKRAPDSPSHGARLPFERRLWRVAKNKVRPLGRRRTEGTEAARSGFRLFTAP